MKALLSLAVVIATCAWFFIGKPLAEWRDEITSLVYQIHNILEDIRDERDNLMALPGWATTSSDFVQSDLRTDMRLRKVHKLNKTIAYLFENKPFGLALTENEQTKYASIKRQIAQLEEIEAKNVESPETTPPESPPPTPTPLHSNIFPPGVDTPEQRREYLKALAAERKSRGQSPSEQRRRSLRNR